MSTTGIRMARPSLLRGVGQRPAVEAGEDVVDGGGGDVGRRRMRGGADVGDDEEVGGLQQRVVGRQRLRVGDVEGGGAEAAVVQGGGQRLLVDEAAAAGVDEDRSRLDRVQGGVVDEVVRGR